MKAKDEEAITGAMQQIADRLPDMRTYHKIYPNPELGVMLIEAYKDVIVLVRKATQFFQCSTFSESHDLPPSG